MSNTGRIVKLDLSGLHTETSTAVYSSFSTPALNGLLYNQYPIHSGGGILSVLQKVAGPGISALKNAAGPTVKSALGSAKGVFSAAVKDAATEGARGMFQPSSNRSSSMQNRSSSMQNRSSSMQNRSSSMQNRAPSPNQEFSSTSSDGASMNLPNPNVVKLEKQLNELGIQKTKLARKEQELLKLLKM